MGGFAAVGFGDGLAELRRRGQPFGGELAEQLGGDVRGHLGEGGRGGLVLVVVARAAVHLADVARVDVAEDIAQHRQLQPPAGRDGEQPRAGCGKCDFSRQRVAETEQEIEQRLVPGDLHTSVE